MTQKIRAALIRLLHFNEPSFDLIVFPVIIIVELVLLKKWCSLINSLKQLRNTAASTGFQSSLWGDIRIADSCNGCGACAEACPTAAIVITKQDDLCSISLDTSRCTQCGLCQDVCCCESIKMFSTVDLDAMLAQIPQVLIIKKQKDIDNLLEPLEQRMSRLLGYVIKN